jgi:CSLREA domain-containing protein
MKAIPTFSALLLLALAGPVLAKTVTTNNDQDTGGCGNPCSLREAIRYAAPGEVIKFDIPAKLCPGPVCVIMPAKDYDPLDNSRKGVFIDGSTQKPKNPNGPDIMVDGSAGGASFAFQIKTSDIRIKGLIINGFKGAGIKIVTGALNAQIGSMGTGVLREENYIGTDDTGEKAVPNGIGIDIVGPEALADTINGNVISGNKTYGIHIKGVDGNKILNNRIGANKTGEMPVPNTHGIRIE